MLPVSRVSRALTAGAALLALLPAARAFPPPRMFPAGCLQGDASFGSGPSLQVNCVAYPLGPGLRVLNEAQRLVLAGRRPGLQGHIVFPRDARGNVYRVWFLDPADPSLRTVPVAPSQCLFGNG